MNIIKWILFPVSLMYGLVMEVRNLLYSRSVFRSSRFDVQIISVGNLEVGGTGKTPFVKYLVNLLRSNYRVAVLSRGYGRTTRGFLLVGVDSEAIQVGDEPLEIKMDFPEVPLCVCENRVTGVAELLRSFPEINMIILDDAFQHRSIHRDVSLLLSRSARPFYKDFVMPTGRLREFRHNYKRADAVMFTSSSPDWKPNGQFDIEVFSSGIRYGDLIHAQGRQNEDRKNNFLLLSGLANPQKLEADMSESYHLSEVIRYGDHHRYTSEELKGIAKNNVGKTWLTTQKDWVKIQPILSRELPDQPVKLIAIETEIFEEERFKIWLEGKLKNGQA